MYGEPFCISPNLRSDGDCVAHKKEKKNQNKRFINCHTETTYADFIICLNGLCLNLNGQRVLSLLLEFPKLIRSSQTEMKIMNLVSFLNVYWRVVMTVRWPV